MSFYELNLAAFVTVNAFLLYRQYRVQEPVETLLGDAESREKYRKDAQRFAWTFFPVYALAVAADWLQVSRLLLGDTGFTANAELEGTSHLRHLQV